MVLLAWQAMHVLGIQRFPKPEFESGYITPDTLLPDPRAGFLEVVDLTVLILALGIATWAVIKKRSRIWVFWISMGSLLYFGFYREGCICSIGAIQNVTLALFTDSYLIPWTVLLFFMLPLLVTLFFGRTFCAGVCPFGALQDLVSFRPQKMGPALNAILGILPYLYLGLAVLYAATGTDFIICRYDPFVGFFRMEATFGMFLFGGLILILGIFIARPYCRFLCPYGVLLNWISRFSRKHITITPGACIECRLCEDSCPYEAIEKPVQSQPVTSVRSRLSKMILIVLLIPFFVLLGGWTGSRIHESLAGVNGQVKLAKQLLKEQNHRDPKDTLPLQISEEENLRMTAFRASGKPVQEVYQEAETILHQFWLGGWILGGFMGLTIGILLASRLVSRYRTGYEPNRGTCFSCARCTDYCPVEPGMPQDKTKL